MKCVKDKKMRWNLTMWNKISIVYTGNVVSVLSVTIPEPEVRYGTTLAGCINTYIATASRLRRGVRMRSGVILW